MILSKTKHKYGIRPQNKTIFTSRSVNETNENDEILPLYYRQQTKP